MNLRETKKAETRAAILQAAKTLFEDKGFDDTRVREIGVAARVSEQTVFNYFPSKDALLTQLAVDWYRGSAEWLEGQLRAMRQQPDLDRFLSSLATALNWAQGERALLRLAVPRTQHIYAAPSEHRTKQDQVFLEQFEANQRCLREIFRVLQRAGAIDPGADPAFIAECYGSLFQGALLHWALRPVSSGEALGDRVVRALRIFLDGLRPYEAGTKRTRSTTTSSRGRSFAPQRP